ncbi:hypothetical protein JG688_00017384 [Phytophthora aleatoria]|uniref:Uncharacterized protein n=1 Tax=Phytophthora aleatoria TaxID=2496075 RepID=A0A8J5MC78_9STRA|nr:hypothetical protein JG688_00017384 [Phytophthora aleatoria]
MFVAPKLSAEQALRVLASMWELSRRNRRRFARTLVALQQHHCFRLRDAASLVDRSRSFDAMLDDAPAKARCHFTIAQLTVHAVKLKLPEDGVTTPSGDLVARVQVLVMLCRHLSEHADCSRLPEDGVTTPSGDLVARVQVLVMLCRHLSEHADCSRRVRMSNGSVQPCSESYSSAYRKSASRPSVLRLSTSTAENKR